LNNPRSLPRSTPHRLWPLALCVACAQAPAKDTQSRPNLVLISVDGLRADHVGVYGHAPSPTPSIDRLAGTGLRYSTAFSQSNESLYSHASLLTGRYVSELALPDYQRFVVPESADTVGEILSLYGYRTGGFVAGGHLRGAYGFEQGFSTFEDEADFGAFFHTVPPAIRWLDEDRDHPFFMLLHGYDCHRPYQHASVFHHAFDAEYTGDVDTRVQGITGTDKIYAGSYYPDFPIERMTHATGDPIVDPAGYPRLVQWAEKSSGGVPLSSADIDHLRAHYDGGLLAADIYIGRFIEALRARDLLDNTLIILTSDHGEDLHDHGFFNHRVLLTDSTTRVPLILAGGAVPDGLRGTTRSGLAQALDIVPTLLAAAGVPAPHGLTGRDLLGDRPPPAAVFQEGVLPMIAARTPTHRMVFHGVPLRSPWFDLLLAEAPLSPDNFKLYDHGQDPEELHDQMGGSPDLSLASTLRAQLIAWRAQTAQSDAAGRPPTDPQLRELLRKRGYW